MISPRDVQLLTVKSLLGPQGLAALLGQVLKVAPGDIVRVSLKIDYRGPAIEDGRLQVGIGWERVAFTEAYIGQTEGINFSESVDFITYDLVCDVPIDRVLGPLELSLYGNVLDMYGKLWNVPGPNIFCYAYDVIEVIQVPESEFKDFGIVSYIVSPEKI